MTREEYRAYIVATVDEAPPVTPEQRAKLAPLLRAGLRQAAARQARETPPVHQLAA